MRNKFLFIAPNKRDTNVKKEQLLDLLFNTELKRWVLNPTQFQYWGKAIIQWIILDCITINRVHIIALIFQTIKCQIF